MPHIEPELLDLNNPTDNYNLIIGNSVWFFWGLGGLCCSL